MRIAALDIGSNSFHLIVSRVNPGGRIEIRVIRGTEEAHLIYLGARSALDLAGRRVALFDVGGGSTELILADARECYFTISLKLGVLRLRDEWQTADPPSAREVAALGD